MYVPKFRFALPSAKTFLKMPNIPVATVEALAVATRARKANVGRMGENFDAVRATRRA